MGRDLRRYPLLADALLSGCLGRAKVRLLLAASPHLEAALERDQAMLIEALAPLTVNHARVAVSRWREGALGDLALSPDEPKPIDIPVNSVTYGAGVNGERTVSGMFDAIAGAELASLIDGEVDRARRDGESDADDAKTYGQRRAEALLALARRGCGVKTEHGEARPSVDVIVDLRWLFGIPEASDPAEVMAWPCQLGVGTSVPLSQVLASLDDATIHLILGVLDRSAGRFRPVGEVTTNRVANGSQRRLLRARDQQCRYPGCDATGRWTRAHHEPPFEQTHRTTVPELVLLCPFHHRLRHHGTHRFDLATSGELTVTRPDGTRLLTTPTGHKLGRDVDPPPGTQRRRPAKQPPANRGSADHLEPVGWIWRTIPLPGAA